VITHREVGANGIRLHIAEAGAGPLVILCHGFPESWYSWRHQLPALAAAGFHAVAPDMRGYGGTDAPAAVDAYHMLHLVGDVVGLVKALGHEQALLVGHDWGAAVVWQAALLRPDLFPAVAALSVPFRPRGAAAPLRLLRKAGLDNHYWFYFQEEGVAEREFERDPRLALRRMFTGLSGEGSPLYVPAGHGFLDGMTDVPALPAWLTEADLDTMTADFVRTGFRGGLNWYRNLDRNWELLAPWAGATITQPALFIAGSNDPVIAPIGGRSPIAAMQAALPQLAPPVLIDGAGHFIQQERPDDVNAALLPFLTACARRPS
jgi:pimeloyl-ACP methyl ester carboxylesterase